MIEFLFWLGLFFCGATVVLVGGVAIWMYLSGDPETEPDPQSARDKWGNS